MWIRTAAQMPLSEVGACSAALTRQVPSSDPEQLRHLEGARLVTGAEVEVVEHIPFGGGVRVRVSSGGTDEVVPSGPEPIEDDSPQ